MPAWRERNPADLGVTARRAAGLRRRSTQLLPGRGGDRGVPQHRAPPRQRAPSRAARRLSRCTTARTRAPGWSSKRMSIAATSRRRRCRSRTLVDRPGHRDAAGARLRDDARGDRAARQPQRDPVLHLERRELLSAGRRDARHVARQRRRCSGCTRATCSCSKRCSAPRADCRPTPTGRTATSCAWRRSRQERTDPLDADNGARGPLARRGRPAVFAVSARIRGRRACGGWRAATWRSPTTDRRLCPRAAGDDLVPQRSGERPYRPVLKKAGLAQAVAFDAADRRRHLRRRAQPGRSRGGASGDRTARQRRDLAAAARSA